MSNGVPNVVRLGSVNIERDGIDYDVVRLIKHPHYSNKKNDIGLIELDRNVTINNNTRPACLDQQEELTPNFNVTAIGWGVTEKRGTRQNKTNILMKVGLRVLDEDDCTRAPDPKQICAGETNKVSKSFSFFFI